MSLRDVEIDKNLLDNYNGFLTHGKKWETILFDYQNFISKL